MTNVAENFDFCFRGSRLMQKANTQPCSFKRSVAASLCEASRRPQGDGYNRPRSALANNLFCNRCIRFCW
jgi:hypothetical protein